MTDSIIVTGGAGFIGSNFILQWVAQESAPVVNLDCLTYAGNAANLASLSGNPRYEFVHGDINDRSLVKGTASPAPTRSRRPFRRREPCGSLHPRAR